MKIDITSNQLEDINTALTLIIRTSLIYPTLEHQNQAIHFTKLYNQLNSTKHHFSYFKPKPHAEASVLSVS